MLHPFNRFVTLFRRRLRTPRRVAWPRGRGLLNLEPLEPRCVPATQSFHGLDFVTATPFTQNGSTYTYSGSAEVGFTPSAGSSFTALLALSGDVTLTDGTDPTFSVNGSVAEAIAGTNDVLFQGNNTFDVNELITTGFSQSGESITVAGATFALDEILLVNTGPGIHLQGSITVPSVAGLQMAVDGSNFVAITALGISLTGVDATLSGSIQEGGLTFGAGQLTADYTHTSQHDTFTIRGNTSFTTGGTTVNVDWGGTAGGTTTAGMVIQDGSLTTLNMTVTGNFAVGGVTFTSSGLSMIYAGATTTYTMTGAASMSASEGGSGPTDTFNVAFGGDSTTGLVIQNGNLQSLNMSVSGNFTVGGLTFTPGALKITYAAASGSTPATFTMTGGATISVAENSGSGAAKDTITVVLGGGTTKGLVVQNGVIQSLNMTVSGSFTTSGLTITSTGLTITYAAASGTTPATYTVTGGATFTMKESSSSGAATDTLTVQFGGGSTKGLVVQNSIIQSLNMAVTADFSVGNLTIKATNLTVTYKAASSSTAATYTVTGAASMNFTDGSATDTLTVTFGGTTSAGTTTPGLVITGGVLTTLEIAVTASLTVGSLAFDAKDLTVTFAAASGSTPATYTVTGETDFTVSGNKVDVKFGGTTSGGTTTKGLIIRNSSLVSLDMDVNATFSFGSLTFAAKDLTVTYDSGTFTMTGETDFSISGSTISVDFGGTTSKGTTTKGLVITNGNFVSLDMGVNANFTFGALTFAAKDLTVTYGSGTFTMTGETDFAISGSTITVTFGGTTSEGTTTKGMVITNGNLVSLDMAVNGSFTIFAVTLKEKDLTISYEATGTKFEMSGALTFSTTSQAVDGSGTKGQVFDSVTASLGTDSDPGLIITNGTLTTLDVTINGSFSLFGLSVSPKDFTIDYQSSDSTLQITGTLTINTSVFTVSASLPGSGMTINTSTGNVEINDVTISADNVVLGAFTIEQFYVSYTQTSTSTTFIASISLEFPGDFAVSGAIEFVNGDIESISVSYSESSGEGIPVGPLYIQSMSAAVYNLTQPDILQVAGSITFDVGPHITIAGESVVIAEGSGTFIVDSTGMTISTYVYIAPEPGSTLPTMSLPVSGPPVIDTSTIPTPPSNGPSTLIGYGGGILSANWSSGDYTIEVDLNLFDGIFKATGTLEIDSGGDFLLNVKAAVEVPNSVPVIGGEKLGSMDFAFKYLYNSGSPTGFIAAWTKIDLWIIHKTVGFKYDLNGNFSLLGSRADRSRSFGSWASPRWAACTERPTPNHKREQG